MGSTIALQYTLDHPEDVSRLALLASLPGLPEEMAEARETQMAFIKSHNLREIAENRVGAAFTESADQGVRARATSPTSRSPKRSTRSSPTGSESQRSLSRSGRRTDSSPSLIDDSTRQQRRALARPIGQRTGVIPGHSQTPASAGDSKGSAWGGGQGDLLVSRDAHNLVVGGRSASSTAGGRSHPSPPGPAPAPGRGRLPSARDFPRRWLASGGEQDALAEQGQAGAAEHPTAFM